MKILDIENEIWWWKYLPPKKPIIQLRVARIRTTNLLSYFIELFKIYVKLDKYDVVITQQDSYETFFISFINSILGKKKCKHFVNEFITSEKKAGVKSAIKYFFLRFCLSSVHCFICSSTKEIEYYRSELSLNKTLFVFIPLATDPRFFETNSNSPGEFIISAGRTGRDYSTLLRAAEKIPYQFKIVAGLNFRNSQMPNNVSVVHNIPLNDFLELIANAKFVVLPLMDKPISIGQTVLLQSMAMGKAIIATRNAGTWDYLDNNVNSILVPPYDEKSLCKAILFLLDNPSEIIRLGNNAKKNAREKYMIQKRIKDICSLITEGNL